LLAEGEELGSNLLQVDHRIKAGSRVLPRIQQIGAPSRWRESPIEQRGTTEGCGPPTHPQAGADVRYSQACDPGNRH
jgi:hypothetical protein